jgi:predicted PurR-regulated permease PerM
VASNDKATIRTVALVILATLAVIGGLYVGREFLVPIALAFLFNALLRPVVRALQSVRVPAPVGATIVVLGLLALVTAGGFALSGPAQSWAAKAPQTLSSVQEKLKKLRKPLQKVSDAAAKVSQPSGSSSGSASSSGTAAQSPSSQAPTILARVFGTTTSLIGGAVEVLLLLYLLLAVGDLFLQKLVKVLPFFGEKRAAVEIVHEAESAVTRYLVTTLFINIGQGVAVALALWLLKMPNPELWGVLTVFAEFVPYLGAAFMIVVLGLVAATTLDSLGHILLAPGSYLIISTLQNNLVSPVAYGQRLKLNPVVVLVGVIFWWYVWGVAGAFLAVPILASAKILADRIEGLRPIGEFLGE